MIRFYGKQNKMVYFMPFFLIASIFMFGSDVFAAEGSSKGRIIWDTIMLWFNFGILVFLFIKFAKNPLVDFIRGESRKIGKIVEDIEERVKNARLRMEEEAERLKKMDEHVVHLKESIVKLGLKEKEEIIEKAKYSADMMIEDAKREAKYKLEIAKKRFSEDMLEIATSLAVEKLKQGMSSEDNERIVEEFSDSLLNSASSHFL